LTGPFALLPTPPLPVGPGSHPRMRYDTLTNRVYLMALAGPATQYLDDGNVTIGPWATFWDGGAWSPPIEVSPHVVAGVGVRRGPVLGQAADIHTTITQFSFAVGTACRDDAVRIVYTSEELTPGSVHLVGYACNRDLTFCAGPVPGWSTQHAAGMQYNPQIAAEAVNECETHVLMELVDYRFGDGRVDVDG
jgi:hypothetical protein